MKRFHGIILAVLASLAACPATTPAFGDTYKVVVLQNTNWKCRLLVAADAAVTVNTRGTECKVTADGDRVTLPASGAFLSTDFGTKQCGVAANGIGLATIETSGPVSLTTEAVFSDAGKVDTAAIPALSNPLPASGTAANYVDHFAGIETSDGRTTSIAAIPDAPVWLRVTVYDGSNKVASVVDAYATPPYTLIPLPAGVPAGRAELVEREPQVGCDGCAARATVYAVGFVSDGVGSPRVVVPRFVAAQ